ncbi:MAG: hypothetical protein V1882_01015 [Candidatus Omnitrophota bacterium]
MKKIIFFLMSFFILIARSYPGFAIPVNDETAFTVFKDQWILREQVQYAYESGGGSGEGEKVISLRMPTSVSYGLTDRWSAQGYYPVVYHELSRSLNGEKLRQHAAGPGDLKIYTRYLFWKDNTLGQVRRAGVIGGMEFPTGATGQEDRGKIPRDYQPGKGTWNPSAGANFTWETFRHEIDSKVMYVWDTERRGYEFGDTLTHDLNYQMRVWPWKLPEGQGLPTYLLAGVEANGIWERKDQSHGNRMDATGGYTLFLSPSLQVIGTRFIWDASIQLPVIQSLNGEQPKTRFVLNGGIRYQF